MRRWVRGIFILISFEMSNGTYQHGKTFCNIRNTPYNGVEMLIWGTKTCNIFQTEDIKIYRYKIRCIMWRDSGHSIGHTCDIPNLTKFSNTNLKCHKFTKNVEFTTLRPFLVLKNSTAYVHVQQLFCSLQLIHWTLMFQHLK